MNKKFNFLNFKTTYEKSSSYIIGYFILPPRLGVVSTVHQQQRKHLLAAHREIHQTGEEVIAATMPDGDDAATELPDRRHVMSIRKSSVPDVMTTSTDDSSLENMFLAIEEHHRSAEDTS